MIFQDPMTSLNPVLTIGDQIAEAIQAQPDVKRGEARERARSSSSTSSASRTRSAASTSTRTSSRAGCASGR